MTRLCSLLPTAFTIRTCILFTVFSARSQLIWFQLLLAVLSRLPASLSCAASTVFAPYRNRTPTGSLPPFGVWHGPLCQLLPLTLRLLRYLLPAGYCSFLAVCLLLRESIGLTLFRVRDSFGWLGPFRRPERLCPPDWYMQEIPALRSYHFGSGVSTIFACHNLRPCKGSLVLLTIQPFPEFLSALVGILEHFAQRLSTSPLTATHPLVGISQVGRIAFQQSLTRLQVAICIYYTIICLEMPAITAFQGCSADPNVNILQLHNSGC